MVIFLDKIRNYLIEQPHPHSAFQISSRYLSGIHISPKERRIKSYFIFPLESGVIQPSFSNKNIKNPEMLEKKIREGLKILRLSDHKIACLIPELSLKAFVFSFSSLPPSRQEKEQIIRFRIKKQVPLLANDARFSFERIKSNNSEKILAAVAGALVVREYEDFFNRLHLKVRVVSIPTLSLNNLMNMEKEKDFILINIEEDSLGIVVIVNSEIVLYRIKPIVLDSDKDVTRFEKIENIAKEVENTINFIEDREKKKIHSLWLRLGVLDSEEEMHSMLQEKLSFPLKGIEDCLPLELGIKEKKILSPLVGQIL